MSGSHRVPTRTSLPSLTLPSPPDRQISRFVRYLAAIEYWQRADLGHWEEWPALVRTSSIGCCVAGLRAAACLLPSDVREELRVDALADKARTRPPRLGLLPAQLRSLLPVFPSSFGRTRSG